jgi:DNA-binding beta-propeller fold protein YncE
MRNLILALLWSACGEDLPAAPTYQSTCTAAAATDEAKLPAGRLSDGTVILPDGRKLAPAGKVFTIGGFPVNLRVLPGDRYVVASDAAYGDEHLRVIDTRDGTIVSDVPYLRTEQTSHAPALWYGLALTRDGSTLYVSNGAYDPTPDSEPDPAKHFNVIDVFTLAGAPPVLQKTTEIHLFSNGISPRLPAGMALSADEKTLYVTTQLDGTLAVVDLRPGPGFGAELGRTPQLGIDPYDVVLDEPNGRAYVSLWGGVYSGASDFADGIQTVDISNPMAPMPAGALIAMPKATEGLALVGNTLYVSATDGDAVVAYPLGGTAAVTRTAIDATDLYGSSPTGLAVDPTRNRLYVANANENAVQVFDTASMMSVGRIPTAWYPTAIALAADGTLFIAAAKGLGAGPSDHAPDKNDYMQGTLQVLAPPTDDDLRAGDAAVKANFTRPRDYEVKLDCKGTDKKFVLPAERGQKGPIEHVFLIVRENKTYDAVLGDQPGTNGLASLALFGGDITPNLHALAARFANLDNFYSLAEQSLQGHEWTTTGFANDYTEKAWLTTWGRATRPLGAFSAAENLGHLTLPASPTIWGALDAANLSYHNYGEIVNSSQAIHTYDVDYPGVFFNTGVLDVTKIAYVVSNLQDKKFVLEPFSYISLPNDHTVGDTPGKPTPRSMIADNDEATGRFVDALSHSSYWAKSIVFIIEDDPQDGGDHVEIHRSPCVVASPWVKAGYVSSVHYDVPAMYKTITLLLGIGPINSRDANAAAFYDLFTDHADVAPYTYLPRKIAEEFNSADAPLAGESARIDFSRPDSAPLGRILWKSIHGKDAEPPWGAKPLVRDDDD